MLQVKEVTLELPSSSGFNHWLKGRRGLTGFIPVSMPTYPAKFVDLKTVWLLLLKSRLTTRGFSISEMIHDLFLASQLEEAQDRLIAWSHDRCVCVHARRDGESPSTAEWLVQFQTRVNSSTKQLLLLSRYLEAVNSGLNVLFSNVLSAMTRATARGRVSYPKNNPKSRFLA